MSVVYQYWGFQLHIASEIEFPELLPATFDAADVTIKKGIIPTPPGLPPGNEKLDEFLVSAQEYYLDIKGVCKYHVVNGREITIEPYPGMEGRDIRIFLLATVMAVVLLQRGAMPLHASAILKDEKLLMFTGDSGAGKSTTLAALAADGYWIFTDDVCVLKMDDVGRQVLGIASYPMLKLWGSAVDQLDDEKYSDRTFRVNSENDKFGYFFYDDFIKEPYPISRIFILKKSEDADAIAVRQLSGMDAFAELEKQAYRKYLISGQDLRALHFRIMSLLAGSSDVYEVTRPAICNVTDLTAVLKRMF